MKDADVVVLASPVYYWSFSGQMQSTITRLYSIGKPQKATRYAMILSSGSSGVYDAIISQYNSVISYFGAKNAGIVTAYGHQNKSQEKLDEAFNLGKSL